MKRKQNPLKKKCSNLTKTHELFCSNTTKTNAEKKKKIKGNPSNER